MAKKIRTKKKNAKMQNVIQDTKSKKPKPKPTVRTGQDSKHNDQEGNNVVDELEDTKSPLGSMFDAGDTAS